MIEFHLETRSGVPTYLQIVQQVRQAVRLGVLRPGDQLPTVKEVVGTLTDQPQHRAEGLPRAGPRGPGGRAPGRRHLRRRAASRRCRPATCRTCARGWSAGSPERAGPAWTTTPWPRCSGHAAPAGDQERRMTADQHAGTRQALRLQVGAAGLHDRGAGGLGHRARRPQRRRQDDAAAARRRADPTERGRRHGARPLAARRPALLPRVGFVAPGASPAPRLHGRRDAEARAQAQPRLGRRARPRARASASGCRSIARSAGSRAASGRRSR